MTTRYCFTKVSEGYWEESHAFTDEKHAEKNGSLLKLILTSVSSVDTFFAVFLNSLFLRILFEQHLLYFWRLQPFLSFPWLLTSCLSNFFICGQINERFLNPFQTKQFYFGNFKMTVKVVSWFWQKQNNLVGQLKRFEIIVRHSLEISVRMTSWPPILPYYHEQRLWIPLSLSGISNPRPGITPGTALRAVGSGNIETPYMGIGYIIERYK